MVKSDIKFCLIILAAIGLAACRKKSEPTTFGEVCERENQTIVELEGYLRLLTAASADAPSVPNFTPLLLVEKPNGTGGFLYALIADADAREPNRMRALPGDYPNADLHVFADDGVEISSDRRVKVTGEVVRRKEQCVLKINRIETR